jgi:hypothetical protein
MNFPGWSDAPKPLLAMDGHCGLIAAWTVLRYFGKRVSLPNLVKACGYTKRYGVFTVGLAAGLKQHGLGVSFHSDPDTQIGRSEKRCYARACHLGVLAEPALDLPAVLRERRRGRIPIVFFNTSSDVGHFSPLLGIRNGQLRLPLAEGGKMSESDFIRRWTEPEILRQCVITSR